MGNFTFTGKMVCLALTLSFIFGVQQTQAQSKQKPSQQEAEKLINSANSISFIENKGQWPDNILYHVDVPGGQMSVTPEGMLMSQYDLSSFAALEAYDLKREQAKAKGKSIDDLGKAPFIKGHAWRFNFVGGNKATTSSIERAGQSNDYFNFLGYNGKDVSSAFGFTQLTYKNVYQNIDVKYYTSAGGALENDVIIKPGADGSQVKIQIDGVHNLKMNAKGELVLPTTVGNITVTRPVSYLVDSAGNRTEIDVKYVLTGKNTLSFKIPAYDKTKTLVIDPIVMRWATWVTNASSADGHNHGIDVDASGNIYVTGKAAKFLIVTAGAFQTTDSGTFNVFVGKYQEPATPGNAGVRVWQTYFGSTSTDIPYVLTIGTDGYLYIAGTTSGNLSPTFGTGFTGQNTWTQRFCNDVIHQQAFIAKVSPAGTGALVRELGPASKDFEPALFDLRVLSTGTNTFDLVAVGYVTEAGNAADGDIPAAFTPAGTAKLTTGDLNGYALRITSNLQTISWTKQITSSGNNSDVFNISVVDSTGNIYIAGSTQGSAGVSYNNPSAQTALVGYQDGWILKLNSAGAAQWSRYYNSKTASDFTNILCMEFNQTQTSFVLGGVTSSLATTNITAGSYHTAYYGGNSDFFVSALPKTGASTTWGTYYGGSNDETNMMGLNVDVNNDVYVLGYSYSKNLPVPRTDYPVQDSSYDTQYSDAIFFKIHADGTTLDYATYLGGDSSD